MKGKTLRIPPASEAARPSGDPSEGYLRVQSLQGLIARPTIESLFPGRHFRETPLLVNRREPVPRTTESKVPRPSGINSRAPGLPKMGLPSPKRLQRAQGTEATASPNPAHSPPRIR